MGLKKLLPFVMFPNDLNERMPSKPEQAIRNVLGAFATNHYRWQSHRTLAFLACLDGMEYERSYRQVLWNTYRRPFQMPSDTITSAHITVQRNSCNPFFDEANQKSSLPTDWSSVFYDATLFRHERQMAVDVMFSSQVVSAWTMFETLAGDLWIELVNEMPNPLALLNFSEQRISKKVGNSPDPEIQSESDGDEKPEDFITLNSQKSVGLKHVGVVTDWSFNLSDRMGDLLVRSKRVGFQKLEDTREAYSMSFPDDGRYRAVAIDNALADQSLDILSIVRNVIVHSGGIVDEEYDRKRKGLPNAPARGVGESFEWNVDSVARLVEPVVDCSVKLINGADKWLKYIKSRAKST